MKQAHLFITGFVQGVGFRAFVKNQAKRHNIVGWIKNLPDGRVEAVFQGEEDYLKEMIKLCEKGSFVAEVEEVETFWEDISETYHDFKIV